MENPFRPTAGASPPEIIGRAGVLDEFTYGLHLRADLPIGLVLAGLIEPAGDGLVRFAVPGLREHLRQGRGQATSRWAGGDLRGESAS